MKAILQGQERANMSEISSQLTEISNKIDNIATPGEDTSDATATADDIRNGKTAYARGNKIIGTIEDIATPLPVLSLNNTTGLVTATVAQGSGYTNGGTRNDTLQLDVKNTNSLTVNGATVNVPAGYYPNNVSKAVGATTQATPSITVSSNGLITASATQSTGYVSEGTKSATKQLATQAATTITPGTTAKTAVETGRYTTGAITVAGDTNLKAENIATGVSIFGVAGNLESGGREIQVKLQVSPKYGTAVFYVANPGNSESMQYDLDATGTSGSKTETITIPVPNIIVVKMRNAMWNGIYISDDLKKTQIFGEDEGPTGFNSIWYVVNIPETAANNSSIQVAG